jgi:hypothetical protein
MRTLLVVLSVMVWVAAFALPVMGQAQDPEVCDVSFDVDALKTKNIAINKAVNKTFNFNFDLTFIFEGPLGLAEVEAFKCDHNTENAASVVGIVTANTIVNSFSGFVGVAQVNQSASVLNNQGNVLAAGLTGLSSFPLSMVEAAVEKLNFENALELADSVFLDNINNSFNGFTGLAQVNQASGILNNQDNVLALGSNVPVGGDVLRPQVAENDTFLTMQNTGNAALVSGVVATSEIRGSFNSYTGISQVNQSPGSLNNQANITSFSLAR